MNQKNRGFSYALSFMVRPDIEELRVIEFFVMELPVLAAAGRSGK